MRLHRLVLLLCLIVFVAGCGSSSSKGGGGNAGADPAQAIPVGTLVYVEGSVRPTGTEGDAARALLARFLPSGTSLEKLIDQKFASVGEGSTYAQDVRPWLGRRVGIGVTDLTQQHANFVGSVAITDAGKAEAFLAKDGKPAGSYRGAKLFTDADTWAGVKGDHLVFAEDANHVKTGLDAAGKASLGDSSVYRHAIAALPDARLGAVFLDVKGLSGLLDTAPGIDPAGRAVLKQMLGKQTQQLTAALTATEQSATIESRLPGALGLLGSGTATDLVKDAPADAFAVFGAANVGGSFKTALNTLAGAVGGAALTGQLEAQTGLDLDRDVFSWVGDVAVYARGTSLSTLGGALVIGVRDQGAAKAAIPRLIAAAAHAGAPVNKAKVAGADAAYSAVAPGAPGPLVLAEGKDRVVLAFGEQEAASALEPAGDTLDSSGRYDDARSAIDGLAPALIVSLPAVLKLAESSGNSDPQYAAARPYLAKLGQIVVGSEKAGSALRSLLTVTTR
jgi:hypothetical protein